jgi:ABC-type phosphate/phosphonate transport system ATPase subunit
MTDTDTQKIVKPENKQVFDYNDMPFSFEGEETSIIIAGKDGAGNDTYHRWYPGRLREEVGKYKHFETQKELEAGKALNEWLLQNGMVIKNEFLFHVLIHISW